MENFSTNAALITAVLMNYFNGIYNGDVSLLQSVFHQEAIIGFDQIGRAHV